METYVIFTNDDGEYYLETVSSLDIDSLYEEWDITKVRDNKHWELVKNELNNPTIPNGTQLAVKQDCYE